MRSAELEQGSHVHLEAVRHSQFFWPRRAGSMWHCGCTSVWQLTYKALIQCPGRCGHCYKSVRVVPIHQGWSITHTLFTLQLHRPIAPSLKQWWVCFGTAWWSRDRNKAWPHEAGGSNPVTFSVIHPISCVIDSSQKAGREGRCLGGRRGGKERTFPYPPSTGVVFPEN